jgi:hypothetical protein
VTDNTRKTKRQKPATPLVAELIVRRGALRRFDKLKHATADLPVTLTWDRRLRERRASGSHVDGERRQTDRRKKPPFTWNAADFVLVEPPARRPSRANEKSKRR